MKHENFTLSYHSYATLLPQNTLQLQLHLVVRFTASTIWGLQKLRLVGMVSYHYIGGVQPFAIAGRITFIYMKYGGQWVRVISEILPSANQHRTHSNINCVFILQLFVTSPSRLLRIVSTDFLVLRFFVSIYSRRAVKSYILNYMWTPTNIIIKGRRLCTVGLHVPNFKMFISVPKFEWSCFSWSNIDLGCCNLLKYL